MRKPKIDLGVIARVTVIEAAAQALGFTKDEIAAMAPEALSWAVYQRISQRGGGGEGGGGGAAAPSGAGAAMLHGHKNAMSRYAPPPGSPPPDPELTQASARFTGSPGFDVGGTPEMAAFQSDPFAATRWGHMPVLAELPRARTYAEAAGLPKGSCFLAPDASTRRII